MVGPLCLSLCPLLFQEISNLPKFFCGNMGSKVKVASVFRLDPLLQPAALQILASLC